MQQKIITVPVCVERAEPTRRTSRRRRVKLSLREALTGAAMLGLMFGLPVVGPWVVELLVAAGGM